ncbi:MAG TPA: L-threonylcarbamoyladenylate synthase, partial [Anaerolineae bacterium]|nr:L-threonylcarbamoyladenylate synthase [Anaerolineae bacterium]
MPETLCLEVGAPGALEKAIQVLNRGEVVAFPTDTVYGVGAHAFLPEAVERLYGLKERPGRQAIPLLLPDAEALHLVCQEIPPLAWLLVERFWPGGLSLVLPRADSVPAIVTAGGDTVAVRVPDHDLVRSICRGLGAPLAATSANLHGQPAPVTASEVLAALGGRIPLLLDGGACRGGVASTLLDLTVSPPAILRSGPISAAELAGVVGEVASR